MVQSDTASGTLRRRRSGGWLRLLVACMVLLAGGWTAMWFYAVHRAGAELDGMMDREKRKGRTWACAERSFGGFPLEISMACRDPSFAGKVAGKPLTARAHALNAKVALYDPNRVVADVAGPLHIVSGEATAADLTWSGLVINLKGPLQFERASIELQRPELTLHRGGEAQDAGSASSAAAASAAIHIAALDRRSAKDSDQEIRVQIANLVVPALDAVFASSEPAKVDITGIVSKVDALKGATTAERLENWRAGGGRLQITDAFLVKGAARFAAAGLLSLDDEHRLQGDLTVGMSGFEPLLKKAHVPVRAISLGGLLGGLTMNAGGIPLPDHGGKPPDMQLGLTLADGHISLGPVSLPTALEPLY